MIIDQFNEKCLRNSKCYFGGYFHFLLLKLGYSNKTNNPNDSPSKRMFGLFSCGRNDRVCFTTLRRYRKRYANLHFATQNRTELTHQAKKEKTTTRAIFSFFGRNDRIRTCDIVLPNAKIPIFSLLYKAFRGFRVRNQCFRVLLQTLFPRSPKP